VLASDAMGLLPLFTEPPRALILGNLPLRRNPSANAWSYTFRSIEDRDIVEV